MMRAILLRATLATLLSLLSAKPAPSSHALVSRCCGPAGSISVFHTATNQIVSTFPAPAGAVAMVSNAARTRLYLATSSRGQVGVDPGGQDAIWVIDPGSGQILQQVPLSASPGYMVINPAGDHIYATTLSSTGYHVLSLSLNNLTNIVLDIPRPTFVGFFPIGISVGGATVFVANGYNRQDGVPKRLLKYDGVTLKSRGCVVLTSTTYAPPLATPDGKSIVVATNTGYFDIVDLATNTLTAMVPFVIGLSPQGLALSPNGKTAYINDDDVIVVDISKAKVKGTVAASLRSPYGIAITPDGSILYAAGLAHSVLSVIDTATLKLKQTMAAIAGPLAVVFDPHGNGYILNADGLVRGGSQLSSQVEVGAHPTGEDPTAP